MGAARVESVTRDFERLCAELLDHPSLQEGVAALVREVVPFEVAVQATVDPASMLDTSCQPVGMAYDAERERHFMHLEYTSDDPLSYVEVAARPERAAALRAEVDDLRQVRRYRELLEGFGVTDELRTAFVADGQCWGTLTLYRADPDAAFNADEVAFFTTVSATVARGLRRAFLRAAAEAESLDDPPGHCTISRSGQLLTTSAAAERWLDTLDASDRLPPVLAALLARLDHETEVRTTVVGPAGPLTIHATPVKGGDDDAVAVIIEKPRPIHLAPLVIAAYGLTPRESEVAEAVRHGLTTRQIARRLGIVDYTVQDHLKAIFAKVGVATRGELAWELYERHYLPPTEAGATPSPYGYFLPDA